MMKEYEDLSKTREDQDEKLESIKGNTKDILERRKGAESEITKLTEEIEKLNKMIAECKEKALEKDS